ncbi:Putative D-alanyl-D-alanine carboxypeptidase [Candidatus Lokiarchaeum ossiferum]|uniref:D-alanyl-D-alanine carboxypeptidase n=1 Tax=Candidatus Lokiarchaeum ossiferum TaxID=2951803 RepID=A0ABY6HLW1_9ARCH|nr:Putative D-alanyl-D-alanine carboxypeptidase [Candidatus Lokiarchaeum sp. B-35]
MKQKYQYLTIVFITMFLFGITFNHSSEDKTISSEHSDYIPNSAAAHPPRDINNISQIEEFLDEFIPNQLEESNIAGVTISMVHNDSISLVKGYGYSDISKGKNVQANSTIFRVGSISKLFIWTAIMQLYEEGKVDLNTDINNYLTAFQIPDTFDEPITLTHLMTHTAGFEETLARIIDPADVFPVREQFLRENLPPRYFEPGTVPSYSNLGSELAALIVEEVAQTPFEEYVKKNIFQKLNMSRSTFLQPLPVNVSSSMSNGYYFENEQLQEGFFEYLSVAAAGGMSSTAEDMAHFLIAQLNNGTYGSSQILAPETLSLMHTPQFQPHPEFPTIRYGFYDLDLLGQTSFGHGGDTYFFHSQLSIFPEYNFGMFISYNSQNSTGQTIAFQANFMKEFMETTTTYSTNLTPVDNYQKRVTRFTGYYETTRVPYSTPDKLYYNYYADSAFKLTSNDEGQLEGFGLTFLEVEENVFQDTRGLGVKLLFVEDATGNIRYMYTNDAVVSASMKFQWFEYSSFQMFLVIIIPVIFGLSIIFWIGEGIWKHVKKKKHPVIEPQQTTRTNDISISNVFKEKPKSKWVINWPRIIVLAQVLLSVVFVVLVRIFHVLRLSYILPYDDFFDRILIIPYFIFLFIAATGINAILEWFGKNFQRPSDQPLKAWEKVHFSLVAATGLLWLWVLSYWNLLGFNSGGVM